jgi:hypothetical protein
MIRLTPGTGAHLAELARLPGGSDGFDEFPGGLAVGGPLSLCTR